MLLTEADLRALWQNGRQPLPPFPPGTRFSPSAQDFLKDHGLAIQFASSETAAPPPAAVLPAPLQARLDALSALAALTAAQARHYRLPALATRLDRLAADAARLPADPAPQPPEAPAPAPLPPPPPMPNHPSLHWLRLLRAEATALARETATPPNLSSQLDGLAAATLDLERRFLSGELAWPVGPA